MTRHGARWTALILVASMMFFAYMFVDVDFPPIQTLIQNQLGWSSEAYGYYGGSEYLLNMFRVPDPCRHYNDKMGVRIHRHPVGIGHACGRMYQTLCRQPLVCRFRSGPVARVVVDGNARQRKSWNLAWLHDFRL